MLFIKQYWKLILVAVLMCGSNYLTKEYVSRGYENTIAEMNVDGLKQTLELQKLELDKQQKLITEQEKQNAIDKQKQITIANDNRELDERNRVFQQKLRDYMPRNQTSGDSSSIATRANAATDRLLHTIMLQESIQRNVEVGKYADQLRSAVESCNNQYRSIREVFNEKEK